jgi:heptosyltransferase-2
VWATKRWPSYDALAATLAERFPVPSSAATAPTARVVVIGGPDDAPLARAIVSAVAERQGPRVVDATGRLSLLASAALLARARVLVTNDSAPLHLASAMNTPTIALFGPTIPAFGFGPLSEIHHVVERHGLACRPCGAHGPVSCPLGHWQCMRDLTAEQLIEITAPLVLPA